MISGLSRKEHFYPEGSQYKEQAGNSFVKKKKIFDFMEPKRPFRSEPDKTVKIQAVRGGKKGAKHSAEIAARHIKGSILGWLILPPASCLLSLQISGSVTQVLVILLALVFIAASIQGFHPGQQ